MKSRLVEKLLIIKRVALIIDHPVSLICHKNLKNKNQSLICKEKVNCEIFVVASLIKLEWNEGGIGMESWHKKRATATSKAAAH